MEVAEAVQKEEVPMGILPGGTANLMSVELGIPKDLTEAAQNIIDPESVVRWIDMGQVGEQRFMLRVGMGFSGEKVKLADRELKDKWGILAYSIAGLKALKTAPVAKYHVTVDGEEYQTDGKTCLIDNAGNMGTQGIAPSKTISISDGLLDVLIIRDAKVGSWIALGKSMRGHEDQDAVKHWQGREIYIKCDPPQDVQGDGEIWGQTPVSVQVLPGVLPIMTPTIEQKE
jgi:YegS/Rv2252/BmrU family lipid kinase